MAGLHRDKGSAASCRYFVMRNQLAFNDGAIVAGFNHTRYQAYWLIGRRWPPQRDLVVGSDCTGWMVGARALHQVISSGPVAMTVEQRTDNAATEHSGK